MKKLNIAIKALEDRGYTKIGAINYLSVHGSPEIKATIKKQQLSLQVETQLFTADDLKKAIKLARESCDMHFVNYKFQHKEKSIIEHIMLTK